MKNKLLKLILGLSLLIISGAEAKAQISLLQDYNNYYSAPIGTFQGINFREAGFSALYPIAGTNGKEFWTCSDRGVNVDAANANPSACRPTYDKIYSFPSYAPKIHRIRLNGDSIQILQSITMKRPNGTTVTGVINPTGFGSTAAEVASTDTVLNCANFNLKIAAKDEFGIDSEGLVVDADGNFWICEEGGPTIWKLNKNGVVLLRYSPYANLTGANVIDVQIDTVFKYRKNNRGFEGIAITPNGKIYAIIQSPILFPTKSVGEGTMIHRILEIDPSNNTTRMFAYLNAGIIGASGPNQIRLRDWKIGDLAAINNNEFLVLEAALRGTTDIKKMYKIDISAATQVTSGLYGGLTLEALVNSAGLTAKGIVPVSKVLFMDLLANSWPTLLEKAEGLAIVNDSTLVICNDNDYGQLSIGENGVATPNGILSHAFTYRLSGSNKLANYSTSQPLLSQGQTGPSTSQTPYINPSIAGAQFTSILTAGESVNSYKMAGIPDGLGAFDNGNNTFTLLVNHEIPAANGVIRAHGSTGAFVSKWIINKSDLSVVSGSDLIQNVKLWNGSGYTTYNSGNPSTLAAFSRFCSADMPETTAFYNPTSSLGTQERIFLNGEEVGIEGRAMAHIVTGVESGTSYELPFLGKSAWENAVASPFQSNKTIVGQTDDGTGGQVYFYIGTKTSIGSDVDKAGLTNGKLYGISVNGLPTELSAGIPAPNTPFSMVDLGQVANLTGAQLNSNSVAAGVTTFLRPEDGAWDPNHSGDFYFATTNSFTAPSRLWKVQFSDIANPELGGSITSVLDGTEGQKMLDNLTIDNYGHILMQEDVGNNAHIGKVWQYSIATDALTLVGEHDPYRFLTGAPGYLTQDEESSGIIDAQSILGQGMFLLVNQAHYSVPGEVYEGGQLLALFNPATFISAPIASNWNGSESSDWNNALNWTNTPAALRTPGATTEVTIPAGVPNFPTLTSPASVAGIKIESGSSFIGSEFLTSANVSVRRTFVNNKWHFLSSPVISNTFGQVFSNSLVVWAKEWNPTTNNWVYKTGNQPFVVGKGYSVGTSAPPVTANFTGTLNSTPVTAPLVFNSGVNPTWNLLGNPFQSPIDWDNLSFAGSVGGAVAVYTGANYIYWNGTVGGLSGGLIPAQNGFFVTTTANGSSVTIPLSARVHNAVPFLKEGASNLLALQVTANGSEDQMFVHLNDNATVGYDSQFDAKKLWGSEEVPQIFSITNSDELAINELPLEGNEVVNIGFKCNINGQYSLNAKGIETFDYATPIILEDLKLNSTQDLRKNAVYSFDYMAADDASRFKLHFKSTTGIRDIANSEITVYSFARNVLVNNLTTLAGEVWVYDMAGRQMAHSSISSQAKTTITLQVSVGAYLVKVVTAKETVNQKVFIK